MENNIQDKVASGLFNQTIMTHTLSQEPRRSASFATNRDIFLLLVNF